MTPTFDFTPYRFTLDDTVMAMDLRHIYDLYTAAEDTGGTAVEIGSYRGASTAALIECLNQGKIEHLHIVELSPTDSLRQVIAMAANPAKVTLHTVPFWESGIWHADLVFVDGDHGLPALADVAKALLLEAKAICMHDSNGVAAGFPDTWGAVMAADLLKWQKGRTWHEDKQIREGERTERGFLVSVIDE